jgi:hypothetical protein
VSCGAIASEQHGAPARVLALWAAGPMIAPEYSCFRDSPMSQAWLWPSQPAGHGPLSPTARDWCSRSS